LHRRALVCVVPLTIFIHFLFVIWHVLLVSTLLILVSDS
jgi:hypothetical protein